MRMMKSAAVGALVGAALVVAGCADTHTVERPVQAGQKLASSASAFVSVPPDGRYGSTSYAGSGQTTAQIVAAAFSRHLTDVRQGDRPAAAPDAALALARAAGATYLIAPTILHWEDRATEWSMKPDRAEIRVVVMEAASGKVLDTAIVKGRSGIATFGGDQPQDLLCEPVAEYVNELF